MNVPYAKKWQKETDKLRQIALDCDLTEELKWGKPSFTFLKKNVAIVIPLKESCAFSFFNGALLKDPKHVLERIGEHTQAGRWIKFTSLREIGGLRSTLKDYLYEAIDLEKSGKKIETRKPSQYPIPQELQRTLDDDAVLRSAFAALTPGRRKSYRLHILSAKQPKTRAARAEKCVPMILSGRGLGPGKGAAIGAAGGAVPGAVLGGGLKGSLIGAAGAGIGAVVGEAAQNHRDSHDRR
jgi:uncharacterized protein YdeI (YjbR/CyaY-like superfamily)